MDVLDDPLPVSHPGHVLLWVDAVGIVANFIFTIKIGTLHYLYF